MTRAEAKAKGVTQYFTGRSCKRGHIGPRRVDNKSCMECARQRQADWCEAHPEKLIVYEAARYAKHRELFRARAKLRDTREQQARNQRRRARQYAAECGCCRWRDIQAMWLNRPNGCEVDHRLALTLGGLHCVRNLQYLTTEDHKRKTATDRQELARRRRAAA